MDIQIYANYIGYVTINSVHVDIALWHYNITYNTNDELTILDLMRAGF